MKDENGVRVTGRSVIVVLRFRVEIVAETEWVTKGIVGHLVSSVKETGTEIFELWSCEISK